jgi:hypothetical protein
MSQRSGEPAYEQAPPRKLTLVQASTIAPRPVRWLWQDRIPLASFGLLGGREGIGKSIAFYWLVAAVTRGQLPGAYYGHPRACVVVATEDSKAHTIVPRLMAAGADLERVYFVTVASTATGAADVVLPVDVSALIDLVNEVQAVLIGLDPLLSRLDASLDSHKDAETRRALEPLSAAADVTGAAVLGLIHVNKSTSGDPLTMLMASRAFAAVARFVLFCMVDPDDERRRLLGLAKSNLGRSDLPTLAFEVETATVGSTAEGVVTTGRLAWLGDEDRTIREAIATTGREGDKSATTEAAEWLEDFLTAAGGEAPGADIKRAGAAAGHTADHLRRARERLRLNTVSAGFPRATTWRLPPSGGNGHHQLRPTAPTATTGDFVNRLIDCSRGSQAVAAVPSRVATTVKSGSK